MTIPDVVLIMFLCMILNLFSSILNNENVLLIVWGIRNSWRYFIYFYSCYVFLKIEDIDYIMSIIWKIYYISIPLVTIERFFVSYPPTTIIGDMIGGIFGIIQGVIYHLMLYFVFVLQIFVGNF